MISNYRVKLFAALLSALLLATVFFSGCDATNYSTEITEIDDQQYDLSVYFGDTDNSIKIIDLIAQYEKETGISVEPVFAGSSPGRSSSLERMISRNNPISAFVISAGEDFKTIRDENYVANIKDLINPTEDMFYNGIESNLPVLIGGDRLLWSTEAFGLAVDKKILSKLFMLDDSAKIIEDLRLSTFEEWKSFIEKLDEYIHFGICSDVILNGTTYAFPNEKSEEVKKLNGVYAISGSDSIYTGNYLMNSVIAGTNLREWELAKSLPKEDAITKLSPGINCYVEMLDLITGNIAGEFAPGIRGESFVDETHYSLQDAEKIFSSGNAIFTILNIESYDIYYDENEEKARNLVLLPIKAPFKENGIRRDDINRKIASNLKEVFCINRLLNEEDQREALDFGMWITEQIASYENSLQKDARKYYQNGNWIKDYSIEEDVSAFYDDAFVANSGIKLWLRDENWSEEEKERLNKRLFEAWY